MTGLLLRALRIRVWLPTLSGYSYLQLQLQGIQSLPLASWASTLTRTYPKTGRQTQTGMHTLIKNKIDLYIKK